MRVAWAAWVQGLLGLAKAALFVLMDLYPQGARGRPSVLNVPIRRGIGGSDLIPSLPGLMP